MLKIIHTHQSTTPPSAASSYALPKLPQHQQSCASCGQWPWPKRTSRGAERAFLYLESTGDHRAFSYEFLTVTGNSKASTKTHYKILARLRLSSRSPQYGKPQVRGCSCRGNNSGLTCVSCTVKREANIIPHLSQNQKRRR
jgi:hypothetical protein